MIFYFSLYSLLLPLGRIWGFYHGFKTAKGIFAAGDISREDMPLGQLPAVVTKESRRERMAGITAMNIENFGTGIPQQEVR